MGKGWLTFLQNHREAIAAMDFFTVLTITFGVLYCFFVISHDRRKILRFSVTRHPNAFWDRAAAARRVALFVDTQLLAVRPRHKVTQEGGNGCESDGKQIHAYGLSQPMAKRRRGALGRKLPPGLA